MHGNTVDIVETLSPTRDDDDHSRFVGRSHWREAPSVYGGQLLGQAVAAASSTVSGKAPNSLHAYFLRPGDLAEPVEYRIEELQDGRSFARRRVTGRQGEKTIFSAGISFHAEEPGASHQHEAPNDLVGPEDLDPTFEHRYVSGLETSFDIRRIPTDVRSDDGSARRALWVRATCSVPTDEAFHYAAVAYLSDFELFLPALERHHLHDRPDVWATSLDHVLWWHAPVRVDDWLLFVRDSPRASGSRGLTAGAFYSLDGEQIATVAQEGLMRVRA
jgi:acyl-CoA thioesterase-2